MQEGYLAGTNEGVPRGCSATARPRLSVGQSDLRRAVAAVAQIGDTVSAVLTGSGAVGDVLLRLRSVVPFDAAMLSAYDPVRLVHRPLALVGYDSRVVSFANSDYQSCPSYRASLGSAVPLRMRDYSFDFHLLPTYSEVLAPAGFRDGATAILRRDGTDSQVGMLVVSQRDRESIDDEQLEILAAVTPMLARIADDRARVRFLRARAGSGELAAVVAPDGSTRPINPDSARLCQEVPGLIGAAVRLLSSGLLASSGYVSYRRQWWRVVMARSDDVSLPDPDVVVISASPSLAPSGLTRRELQVLTLISEGRSNSDIASCLGVSVRTVTTHAEHIMRKMGCSSRASCAARAAAEGICLLG